MGMFFRTPRMTGASLCAKQMCVPHTVSLAKRRRCCSGGAIILGMLRCCFAVTPSLLAGSGEDDVKGSSALLAARVPAKEKLRSVKEVSSHRHPLSWLVAKQSLPAWTTNFWCIGLEVFDLG